MHATSCACLGWRTTGPDESELFLDATQALNRIFDRVDLFLKDDLLRGMFELLVGKPAPMRQGPRAASAVNPAVPRQEGKQLLALATKIVSRDLAGPHKIADRLVRLVRRPNSRQFAGPMQSRQRDRIPSIRLDAHARPFLLGDIESNTNFAMLSHGPPSEHEARLGPPAQART